MLDLKIIRENPQDIKTAVQNKNAKADVDGILEADKARRAALAKVEQLKAERNQGSKEVGRIKREGGDASEISLRMKEIGTEIKELDGEVAKLDATLKELMSWLPNVPSNTAPVGLTEDDNVELRTWGEKPELTFEPKPHWDIGPELDILDCERAAKLSGAGFALYKNAGARLERALINFMLDLHTSNHGYAEVLPPVLVNRASMFGTGQVPKLEDDMYQLAEDGLFLIPTAEVPVTNMHGGEILAAEELPIKYVAQTPCFRREAGAAGRDTRGVIRVHQFNKVEMVQYVHPEKSYEALEGLVANAEAVLQKLNLHYRVIELCTGDLSFAAAKCYDIELWAPGVGRYLEVSSCSNFEDFQARRAGIRFRDKNLKKPQFVHTLNGSGVALPRLMVAIMENYQNADGSITIPEALVSYMGGLERIERAQ